MDILLEASCLLPGCQYDVQIMIQQYYALVLQCGFKKSDALFGTSVSF